MGFIATFCITIYLINTRFKTSYLKALGVYLIPVVIAVIFALFIRTFLFQAFKIPSGAMNNTILIGDHILANKFIYNFTDPKYGDIIIFKYPQDPKKDFIKRIIGIEGDVIEIKEKKVFLNNKLLDENYVVHNDERMISVRDDMKRTTVPKNSYFVMGDNRDNSVVSQQF